MRRIPQVSPARGPRAKHPMICWAACGLVGLPFALCPGLETTTQPETTTQRQIATQRAERLPRATLADGGAARGLLVGSTPRELRWQADDGRPWRVEDVRRIDLPPAAALAPADGPLRRVALRCGNRLTGVLIGLNEQQATFILRGSGRVSVPRTAIAEIAALPGLRDRLYEDFEREANAFRPRAGEARLQRVGQGARSQALALGGGSTRLDHVLDAPIDEGRVQLRFRVTEDDRAGPPDRAGLDLAFATGARPISLRIVLSGAGQQPTVEAPGELGLTTHSLPAREGWRRLAVVVRGGRTQVLVDEHVLAAGPAPHGRLEALSLFCEPAGRGENQGARPERSAAAPGAAVLIDDVVVQEYVAANGSGPRRPGQDMVEFFNGDRLFGAITAADSRGVELTGAFGAVRRAWPEVSRVVLDGPSKPAPLSASGWWCRVILPAPADHPGAPEDTLELAIQAAAEGHLLARHAVAGEMRLDLGEIRRIEPRFRGTRLTLDGGVHHLGDEVRADFRRPIPEGQALSGEFALDAVPPGRAFFTVDVADLEPSGPDTPLGSPFLQDLRAGFLRTDAFVNGQRLGSLNDRLRWRPAIDNPERIRMPVPAGVLKAGRNAWKIEQRPARENPHEFDDAEFGPIAFEFEDGR